jgi:hypothetical protein
MADEDTDRGMTKLSRPVHGTRPVGGSSRAGGPRPIAALVPGITRAAFGRASPGLAQLMEAWVGIVGPTIADITVPRRMARGTLTIGCSGPVAMELQHLSGELIGRINQYLGSQAVAQLRLVQDLTARPPPRSRPQTDPAVAAAAAEAVADLPEGPLRTALAALGQAVLNESPSRLGSQPRTRY